MVGNRRSWVRGSTSAGWWSLSHDSWAAIGAGLCAGHALLMLVLVPRLVLASPTDPARGLSTNWSHSAKVLAAAGTGLEAGISREGDYAKGIELDRKGKYAEAARRYLAANRLFGRVSRASSGLKRRRFRAYEIKAKQQRSLSKSLNRQSFYRFQRPYRNTYYQHYRHASQCHDKWLALRAFGVEPPKKLLQEAIDGYRAALRLRPSHILAQIKLAALYVDTGFFNRGRNEFALAKPHIGRNLRLSSYWLPLAYYYAVEGATEKAWELIRKYALGSRWRRREVLQSNWFDRLRGDPRFAEVVGDSF